MKTSLEEAARNTSRSVAQLLDEIVAEHLGASNPTSDSEIEHQRRLHARAARFLGCMSSGIARRSDRARELVRARLNRRRAHAR
jgi:predicted DNA-binding ribbon-helix-helix protein